MPFNINDFRQRFKDGGARPTLFEIFVPAPAAVGAWGAEVGDQMRFSAEAASIPQLTMGVIKIPYFGRDVKQAGDRVYQPWQCRVLNDELFAVRKALEQWHNVMNRVSGDTNSIRGSANLDAGGQYTSNLQVRQYNKIGEVARTYTLVNCFPTVLSDIQLSWAQRDTIETYDITWEYDYIQTEELK